MNTTAWRDLERAMRRLALVEIPYLEFVLDVASMPDPALVVAGIEGRAFARAHLRSLRQYIGEVP